MGVTLKYPASGTVTHSVALPYPSHEQRVECGIRQSIGRTASGTIYVQPHGGIFYRVTRTFESLSELTSGELADFLEAIDWSEGEVRYEYRDAASRSTVTAYCRVVYPTSETKLMRNVRDVTIVFEQYTHPNHVDDASSVSIGSYGGGSVGSGSPSEPSITSSLHATAAEDEAFSFTLTASGNTPITFGASGLPAWLNRSGAVLSGTPTSTDVGLHAFTVTATNGSGSDSRTMRVVVDWIPPSLDEEDPPEVRHPDEADVLEQIPFEVSIYTTGSRPIAFSSSDAPVWVSIDAEDGTISGTPPDEPGSSTVSFTIDAENDFGSDSFTFTLNIAESSAPTITSDDEVVTLPGDTAYHVLAATGSDPIEWTVDEGDLPAWATLHETGKIVVIAPGESLSPAIQSATVDVEAENGAGTDTQSLTLRTGIPGEILTIGDVTQDVAVGDTVDIAFTYRGTDAVVSLVDEPAWATLVGVSGGTGTIRLAPASLAWRVGGVNVNPFVFSLSVDNSSDGGAEDTAEITITVTEPPVIYSSGSDLTCAFNAGPVSRTMQYYTMGSTNSVGLDSDPGTGEGDIWSRSTGSGPPPVQTLNLHPGDIGDVGLYEFVWYAENEYGRTTQAIDLVVTDPT